MSAGRVSQPPPLCLRRYATNHTQKAANDSAKIVQFKVLGFMSNPSTDLWADAENGIWTVFANSPAA